MTETETPTRDTEFNEAPPRANELKRFFRVMFGRGVVVFGVVVILISVTVAVFAPLIAPYHPYDQDLDNVLREPSGKHLLGTDYIGRDLFSRIIYGARTALLIGVITVSVASVIGMTMGLIAGYYGGWAYAVIMRFIDTLMAFPMILLALVIASLLGGGIRNIIIALCISLLPAYARLMCGQVLSVKENDYVLAGRAMGASNLRIMLRHVLPNCFPPLIVLMTMMMGMTILAEAGLSFLGIGVAPPAAAWGSMVNDGYEYVYTHPILSFAPGFAIMLVVLSFNMVGDGLRDTLDPRLRGKI
ncbi:ABC transporter permease [Thermodesulfobacteriota bacterium]